ncbi:MAG: hypothetical protein MJ124_01505 [Lachnospiraceae bacterium]|nr:hypothetical protein [Lachnospiraceae bacterium]
MNPNEEMKLTYSSVLTKDGKPFVRVRFDRGNDFAEGTLPDCTITSANGFSPEERKALAEYLKSNRKALLERAQSISGIVNMMK